MADTGLLCSSLNILAKASRSKDCALVMHHVDAVCIIIAMAAGTSEVTRIFKLQDFNELPQPVLIWGHPVDPCLVGARSLFG